MALSNYADLKASIALWLKRTDLTASIPDFIRLAESRINRELTMRFFEDEAIYTATISSRTMALPADFSLPIALYNTTYTPRQEVVQTLPRQLPVSTVSKRPDYWAVDDETIAFDAPVDVAYTFAFRYVKRFGLSDSAPTNEVLNKQQGTGDRE